MTLTTTVIITTTIILATTVIITTTIILATIACISDVINDNGEWQYWPSLRVAFGITSPLLLIITGKDLNKTLQKVDFLLTMQMLYAAAPWANHSTIFVHNCTRCRYFLLCVENNQSPLQICHLGSAQTASSSIEARVQLRYKNNNGRRLLARSSALYGN